MTYVMYDSVDVATVPRSAPAVAGYTSGNWPTYNELVRRFPHAHHLSIAVSASHDAECLDVEVGDARPDQAPAWYFRQVGRGVVRPVLYASLSVMPELQQAMQRAGVPRAHYRTWAAHYTYTPHIEPGHDACQWTDRALGRNLDESLCVDNFFAGGAPADPLAVLLPDERGAVNAKILYSKRPWLHRHGLKVVNARIAGFRKAIWLAAEKGVDPHGRRTPRGWGIRNRRARYATLWRHS